MHKKHIQTCAKNENSNVKNSATFSFMPQLLLRRRDTVFFDVTSVYVKYNKKVCRFWFGKVELAQIV